MLQGRTREDGLRSVIKGLRQVVPFAEENHGDLPGRAEEVIMIMEEINSPSLRLCFDMGNVIGGNMEVKQDSFGFLSKVLKYVAHVHVKDRRFKPGARGVESCIAGTGAVPLQKNINLLKKSGYQGSNEKTGSVFLTAKDADYKHAEPVSTSE